VNKLIGDEVTVYVQEAPLEVALKIRGVRAMFTEAYPDPVRVVSVGKRVEQLIANPANDEWLDFSIEFCGGTHLSNTSEAEHFVIISEEAVSLGERRIVAVTGDAAVKANENADLLEIRLRELEETPEEELHDKILVFQNELKIPLPSYRKIDFREKVAVLEEKQKEWVKEKIRLRKDRAVVFVQQTVEAIKGDPSLVVVSAELDVAGDAKLLNDTAADLVAACKELDRPVAVFLISSDPKKGVIFVTNVSEPLVQRGLKANAWAKEVASHLGGTGGGRPKGDVGQGNFPDRGQIGAAVTSGTEYAQQYSQ